MDAFKDFFGSILTSVPGKAVLPEESHDQECDPPDPPLAHGNEHPHSTTLPGSFAATTYIQVPPLTLPHWREVSVDGGATSSVLPASSTTALHHAQGEASRDVGPVQPFPSMPFASPPLDSRDAPDSNSVANVADLVTPRNSRAPLLSVNPLRRRKVDDVKKGLPPATPCPWPSNPGLQAPQFVLSRRRKVDVDDGPSSPVTMSSPEKVFQLGDVVPIQSLTSMISTSLAPDAQGMATQQGSDPPDQLKGHVMQIDDTTAAGSEFGFLSDRGLPNPSWNKRRRSDVVETPETRTETDQEVEAILMSKRKATSKVRRTGNGDIEEVRQCLHDREIELNEAKLCLEEALTKLRQAEDINSRLEADYDVVREAMNDLRQEQRAVMERMEDQRDASAEVAAAATRREEYIKELESQCEEARVELQTAKRVQVDAIRKLTERLENERDSAVKSLEAERVRSTDVANKVEGIEAERAAIAQRLDEEKKVAMDKVNGLKEELDEMLSRLEARSVDATIAGDTISQLEAEVQMAQEARQEADTLVAKHAAVIARLEGEKREILAMAWDLCDQTDEPFDAREIEHVEVARTMDAVIKQVVARAEREKDQVIASKDQVIDQRDDAIRRLEADQLAAQETIRQMEALDAERRAALEGLRKEKDEVVADIARVEKERGQALVVAEEEKAALVAFQEQLVSERGEALRKLEIQKARFQEAKQVLEAERKAAIESSGERNQVEVIVARLEQERDQALREVEKLQVENQAAREEVKQAGATLKNQAVRAEAALGEALRAKSSASEEVYAERFKEERDKIARDMAAMEEANDALVQQIHNEALQNAATLEQAHKEREEVAQHRIQELVLERDAVLSQIAAAQRHLEEEKAKATMQEEQHAAARAEFEKVEARVQFEQGQWLAEQQAALEKAFQERLLKLRDQAQGLLEKAINERSKSLEEDLRQVEQQRKEYKEAEQRIAREKEEMQKREDGHLRRLRTEIRNKEEMALAMEEAKALAKSYKAEIARLHEDSPAPVGYLSEEEEAEVSQMDVDEDRPRGSRRREKMPEEMVLFRKKRKLQQQGPRFSETMGQGASTSANTSRREDILPPMRYKRPAGADTSLSERLNLSLERGDEEGASDSFVMGRVSSSSAPGRASGSSAPGRASGSSAPGRASGSSAPGRASGSSASGSAPGPSALGRASDRPIASTSGASAFFQPQPPRTPSLSPPPSPSTSLLRDLYSEIRSLRNSLHDREQPALRKPKAREHGNFRMPPKSRPRPIHRKTLTDDVREEMNALLRIKQDANIVNVFRDVSAHRGDVQRFMTSAIDHPGLEPFKPFWDAVNHPWNDALADIFTQHLIQKRPHLSERGDDIRAHFIQRLNTLQKALTPNLQLYDGETQEEISLRIKKQKLDSLRQKRIRARQETLYSSRVNICEAGANGEMKRAWEALGSMVARLGPSGMSSDESDDDGLCYVRHRPWLSSEVKKLLIFIDENRKTTTSIGTRLPGARPHARIRRNRDPPLTSREAIATLPKNFYDDAWLAALVDGQPRLLAMAPAMRLPLIDDD